MDRVSVVSPRGKANRSAPRRSLSLAFTIETDGAEPANRKTVSSEGDAMLELPDGRKVSLPVWRDSADNMFVDVGTLYRSTKVCVFDVGFSSTAACKSGITYIDGDRGELRYRGYPIEQLAERVEDFCDVIYLLLAGELPSPGEERDSFLEQLRMESLIHEQLINIFKGFKHDAHPMAIMCSAVAALSSFYPIDGAMCRDPYHQGLAARRLIAKIPTLAAIAYKTSVGQPIVYPRGDLGFIANFMHMTFSTPVNEYLITPAVERAMKVFFILHADHEQNASTSTVRIAGSSQASPYACISSGIASLWGPAHGGANEAVIRMLDDIETPERIPLFIERAKDKSDPFRLMGFGHRIYKTFDPRSRIIRDTCHEVLKELKVKDPSLEIAMKLEEIALSDPYFKQRSLYPNVDFYSGIMLRAIGFPLSMYTVLFAVARSVGWVAQWKEMASEPVPRISRPRQMYTGQQKRDMP